MRSWYMFFEPDGVVFLMKDALGPSLCTLRRTHILEYRNPELLGGGAYMYVTLQLSYSVVQDLGAVVWGQGSIHSG